MFKVVGISSCPCGIAHTYMAAKAMENEGKKHGMSVHIETQGQLGPENEVSQKEFDEADAIVLCCGILPSGAERYANLKHKVVEIDYSMVLKKPSIFTEGLINSGLFKPEDK